MLVFDPLMDKKSFSKFISHNETRLLLSMQEKQFNS